MDNHWFVQSVIKPVDAQSFQKIEYIKEGGDEKMMTLIWRLYKKVLYIFH